MPSQNEAQLSQSLVLPPHYVSGVSQEPPLAPLLPGQSLRLLLGNSETRYIRSLQLSRESAWCDQAVLPHTDCGLLIISVYPNKVNLVVQHSPSYAKLNDQGVDGGRGDILVVACEGYQL